MENRLIKNYILRVLTLLTDILVPILTLPYINNILGPDNIGKIGFIRSWGYYFLHLASFGVATYGLKELSKLKEKKEINRKASELYSINLFFSLLSGFCFIGSIFFLEEFNNVKLLGLIYSLVIFSDFLGLDWFFYSFEDYKHIAIKNLIVRILILGTIFFLIKESQDYIKYMFLITLSEMGGRIFNYKSTKKYAVLEIKLLNMKKNVKKLTVFFIYRLINGFSSNLDKLMIGIMLSYYSVGIYSTGIRVILILIPFIEAIGTVIFRKLNVFVAEKEMEKYFTFLKMYRNLIYLLTIPMCVGMIILAPHILFFLGGEKFKEAIEVCQLLTILLILIPLDDLLGGKILLINNKERILVMISIVIAVLNIILNYIFITSFLVVGACLATLICNIISILLKLYFVKKIVKFNLFTKEILKYLLISSTFIIYYKNLSITNYLNLILYVILCVFTYLLLLFISKDKIIFNFIINLKRK